jgi:hypothetical protein
MPDDVDVPSGDARVYRVGIGQLTAGVRVQKLPWTGCHVTVLDEEGGTPIGVTVPVPDRAAQDPRWRRVGPSFRSSTTSRPEPPRVLRHRPPREDGGAALLGATHET